MNRKHRKIGDALHAYSCANPRDIALHKRLSWPPVEYAGLGISDEGRCRRELDENGKQMAQTAIVLYLIIRGFRDNA